MPRIGEFIQIENRLVATYDWEVCREMGSDCQWVWGFFLGWWKMSNIECNDGCKTLNTPKSTELYIKGELYGMWTTPQ